MVIELLFLSINMVFIYSSLFHQNHEGQIIAITVLTMAAAEIAVGLALVIAYYSSNYDLRIKFLRLFRS